MAKIRDDGPQSIYVWKQWQDDILLHCWVQVDQLYQRVSMELPHMQASLLQSLQGSHPSRLYMRSSHWDPTNWRIFCPLYGWEWNTKVPQRKLSHACTENRRMQQSPLQQMRQEHVLQMQTWGNDCLRHTTTGIWPSQSSTRWILVMMINKL